MCAHYHTHSIYTLWEDRGGGLMIELESGERERGKERD